MVAHTTDVVSPVGVSVAHTLAPCQPIRQLRTARALPRAECYLGATGPGRHVYLSSRGEAAYLVTCGENGLYACDCPGYRNHGRCWHVAHAADQDQADALIAASVVEPVIEVVDPVLLAAATSGTDSSAGEPAPCGWKDLDGRCHSAANGTFGQGVYCLPHAWDAYGLGLLNWADARPGMAVSNRTPAPDAPSPDARLCPGCGGPAADGGYTHCVVNRATRRSYCGARAGDLLEAFGG